MEFSYKYLSIFFVIVAVGGQYISDKPCPVRPIIENFDIEKYTSGVWYDVLRYQAKFSSGCDCVTANYRLNADKSVSVSNCCKRLPNTTLSCSSAQAILSEPDQVPLEGKLNIAYGKRPNNVSNYRILSTDYDNYSIVYYCKNIDDNKSSEFAWLLSREPQLSQAVKATADALIDTYFDRSKMYQTEQSAERCEPRDG